MQKRRVVILGSTGSIGTSALKVARDIPDRMEIVGLAAGTSVEALARQAREFNVRSVCIFDSSAADELAFALPGAQVETGEEGLCRLAQLSEADMVLISIVGTAGLKPALAAIEAGKDLAIASKEILVMAGQIVMEKARRAGVQVLPVDSEHNAIFQCLNGNHGGPEAVSRLILTASGGPFRTYTKRQLETVTPRQALCHPNWAMGAKITIDSATLMNKGFEMIEAKWLFGIDPEKIEIVVHPESIIHSAVQYTDGAVKAQLGVADMRLPIQYAFSHPRRLPLKSERLDLFSLGTLHFEKPNLDAFPCLRLAYEATAKGGNMPCVLNAANEVANLAFREGRISFPRIADVIAITMQKAHFIAAPTLDDLFSTDAHARRLASEML